MFYEIDREEIGNFFPKKRRYLEDGVLRLPPYTRIQKSVKQSFIFEKRRLINVMESLPISYSK